MELVLQLGTEFQYFQMAGWVWQVILRRSSRLNFYLFGGR